ncbi:TIGR02646 family protein [Mucilaginibacter rubeus]|uniref:TIGR02646 family protein n=2 Tax=Mucilaginibacter rubeus TaxID=2027860 RepID=A0A5C1I3W9_9SPHI|nr:TIGR02646 family protein [Mucilaginibacter rubeus]
MIKINKDLNQIPESLKPATTEYYNPLSSVPVPTKTTHLHRMKMINDGKYTDETKYNKRYKYDDIRTALGAIYLSKCAYCEQKIELSHVEHYRPKDIYHWLAFSWDNLILACPHCNEYKSTHFELSGTAVTFTNTAANIRSINTLSASYYFRELPKMINPEITDPLPHIKFKVDGAIESNEIRFKYTIEKCKISRTYLKDERRKLLNDFKDDIAAELLKPNKAGQIAGIGALVDKFKRDSKKMTNPYIAFRRYAIRHNWLKEIIKELL